MIKDEEASKIESQYKAGLSYFKQMGYMDKWPECERFKAGEQWPPKTDQTKNLPRPVLNITKYIVNHKVSSVMNENVKMLYTAMESSDEESPELALADEAAEKFTRYSDATWERIKQDELNEEALESGSSIGTGIWHYYWDTAAKGGTLYPWIGEMVGEVLDPINVFFGNPQDLLVHKQPYIIITYRDTVEAVRKEAERNKIAVEKRNLITPDKDTNDEGYDRAQVELQDTEKTTVLLKYWKHNDGTVHMIKTCSGVIIKPDTSTDLKCYPIAVMQWERRKKSIHGVGDIEGAIPNQKAINVMFAMQLMSVQLTGWPKLWVNANVVDTAKINNDPGGMIVDRTPPGQGKGVEYLNPGTFSPQASNLVEQLIDYTKTLASAQDAATGDVSKGQLNASAIMLLQKAAGVPIESIKKRFYRAMEDIGRIWAEFWRVKYNTNRLVTLKDDDGNEQPDVFNGAKYKDAELNLKIDIGPSSQYSEELMMASLDKLFDGQHISLEDYLEFAPKNVVPFKDRLLKKIQAQKEAQQMQIIQQMPPEMQQMVMQMPDEQRDIAIQQWQQQMSQPPQPDPQAQLDQQMQLKQVDHQNKLELQQQKGQIELEKAALAGNRRG